MQTKENPWGHLEKFYKVNQNEILKNVSEVVM